MVGVGGVFCHVCDRNGRETLSRRGGLRLFWRGSHAALDYAVDRYCGPDGANGDVSRSQGSRAPHFHVGLPAAGNDRVCGHPILLVAAKLSLPLFAGNEWRRQDASLADPSLWIGQRCPLLDQIDIGAELSTGECLVVLHRHDCPLCKETLNAAWFRDAACDAGGSRRLALVELPPCAGDDPQNVPRSLLVGRLNSSEPCLLPAPVVILLENGRVVSVATGRESEAWLKELLGRRPNAVAAGSWGGYANPQGTLALVERENDRRLN